MTAKAENWWLGPVSGLAVYGGCVEVLRTSTMSGEFARKSGKKKPLKNLSWKSRRNLMFKIARCTTKFHSMMTLTYPFDTVENGKEVKAHWNKFVTYARRRFGGFEYWWFLEFQKRGAPHFHVMTTLDIEVVRIGMEHFRRAFAFAWMGAIGASGDDLFRGTRVHMHPKAWEALRSENGAQRYVMAYASKTYQKDVPERYADVGRWWGHSKGVEFDDLEFMLSASEDDLRYVLWLIDHKSSEYEVLPKYLFGVDGVLDVLKDSKKLNTEEL